MNEPTIEWIRDRFLSASTDGGVFVTPEEAKILHEVISRYSAIKNGLDAAYALWLIASHPDAGDEPLSKWMANTARKILRDEGMQGMEVLK